jgi:hypothetical protein
MNFSGKSQFQLVAKPLQRDQRGFRRISIQESFGKSISPPPADAKDVRISGKQLATADAMLR